ncbi:MAG: sensor histidine kinase [Balneolales bacterium]
MIQALPCSLIVNEVITNILKHAFHGREKGNIILGMGEPGKKDQVVLTIEDNGIGLPQNFDVAESDTLGMNLINDLSQQLKAGYKFVSSAKGTIFTLQFEKIEPKGIETILKS